MTTPTDELRICSPLLTSTISRFIEQQFQESVGGGLKVDLQNIHATVDEADAQVHFVAGAELDKQTLDDLLNPEGKTSLKLGSRMAIKLVHAALSTQMISTPLIRMAEKLISNKTGIEVILKLDKFASVLRGDTFHLHIDATGVMRAAALEKLLNKALSGEL